MNELNRDQLIVILGGDGGDPAPDPELDNRREHDHIGNFN